MTDDFEIANLALSLIGGKPLTALNNDTAQGAACTRWFDTARDECLRSHPWNFARKRALLTWLGLSGTAVTNSGGLIKITKTAHGLTTGDHVMIEEVAGVTAANGAWTITRVNDNEFTLDGSAFAGAYTTGTGRYLAQPEFGWGYRHTLPADCLRVMRINGADGQENDGEPFEVEAGLLLTDAAEVELRYICREETIARWPADFCNAFALLLASYIANDLTGTGSGRAGTLRQQYEAAIAPKAKSIDSREGQQRRRVPNHDSDVLRARRGGLAY